MALSKMSLMSEDLGASPTDSFASSNVSLAHISAIFQSVDFGWSVILICGLNMEFF